MHLTEIDIDLDTGDSGVVGDAGVAVLVSGAHHPSLSHEWTGSFHHVRATDNFGQRDDGVMSAVTAPVPRVLLAAAAVALVAASCGSTTPTATEGTSATSAVVDTVVAATAGPRATAPPGRSSSPGTDPSPISVPATGAPAATEPATPPPTIAAGQDQAERYLGDTSEVYRRTLDDGVDVVARISSATYATVFGIGWYAPTGSADTCLGDHALFLGVPGRTGWWGSAWTVVPWYDDPVPAGLVRYVHTMPAVDPSGGDAAGSARLLLVQTAPDATEVVLASSDGHEVDRAEVVGGLAVLQYDVATDPAAPFADLLTVVSADGAADETMLTTDVGVERPECGPGDPPERPLPDAGVQPSDPQPAREAIVDRLLTLVDTSVPWGDKAEGLLDDDTGIAAAIAGLATSPYADLASSATYAVDELVFTAPDEAWFRYTITTSASTWPDRIGRAARAGDAWQISRATLCQDLALAASPCVPDPGPVELPAEPEWEAAWQAWVAEASQYTAGDGCPPLSPC